jgi:hypothetical protein
LDELELAELAPDEERGWRPTMGEMDVDWLYDSGSAVVRVVDEKMGPLVVSLLLVVSPMELAMIARDDPVGMVVVGGGEVLEEEEAARTRTRRGAMCKVRAIT